VRGSLRAKLGRVQIVGEFASIEAMANGQDPQRWHVEVDNEPWRSQIGRIRRFKTSEAAQRA
jgi:hypothetical protein